MAPDDVTVKIKYSDGSTSTLTYNDNKHYTIDNLGATSVTELNSLLALIEKGKIWLNANGGVSIKIEEE